jgi:hypothetical protein
MSDTESEFSPEKRPKSYRRIYVAVMIIAIVALIGGVVAFDSSNKTSEPVLPYYYADGVKHFTSIPQLDRGFDFKAVTERIQFGSCLKAFRKFQSTNTSSPIALPSSSIDQEVATIANGVSKVRQLNFSAIPVPELVSADEMKKRVSDSFSKDASSFLDNAQDELKLLTLIPENKDLGSVVKIAYSSQVLGYYSPESKKLVVLSQNKNLSAEDQFVLSHELDHALTDQNLGLPKEDTGNDDEDTAATSLAEGDATFLMQLYALSYFSKSDLKALSESANSTEVNEAGLKNAPAIIENAISFPYVEGMNFVCSRYNAEGWNGVNDAYKKPPKTSIEVMFPTRYGRTFSEPSVKFRRVAGWKKIQHSSFGASDLYQLLAYPGNNPKNGLADARDRSKAWDGGYVEFWKAGNKKAVGIAIKQQTGAPDICESVAAWSTKAFPKALVAGSHVTVARANPANSFVLKCTEGTVRFVVAPTQKTAQIFLDGKE